METAERIANNVIQNVESGETVRLSTLWTDSACVIQFLRRFGCPICRMGARDLTHLKPKLDAANVRLVAIGLEETGGKEFLDSGFWTGELFADKQKKIYEDLNYRRYSVLEIITCLVSKKTREAISKASAEGISGSMGGDAKQMGGTLVVAKGGKVLLDFKQESPADSVPLDRVLHVLGIGRTGRVMPSKESSTPIEQCLDQCGF